MFKKNKSFQQGIIALFPAIVISSILLILCVSVSQSFLAFLYRNQLFEEKIQGTLSAYSCMQRILAKQTQNSVYFEGDVLIIGESARQTADRDICTIMTVTSTTTIVSVKRGESVSAESI